MVNPHPGLPEFEYVKPTSLEEACYFLDKHEDDARPFSGGTDSFVRLRDGVLQLKYLVDIKGFEGMKEIAYSPQIGLTIGAAVPMNQVAAHPDVIKTYPVLASAVRSVASYQLRNRATIIGNICNASPAGDTIGACMALDGVLNVHGISGTRQIPLNAFFLAPGRTVLRPGDIVESITLPVPPDHLFGVYKKLGRNSIGDLSIVGVTVTGYPNQASPSGYSFRILLASVAPVPFEAYRAEAILSEKPITEDVILAAAQAVMAAVNPIDDVRSSARYRKYMSRNLAREAVAEVWARISK